MRIGHALRAEFTRASLPRLRRRSGFVEKMLRDVFGFADPRRVGSRTLGEREFAVTLEGPGQTEADYAIPKGLTLRDEIARYFRAAGLAELERALTAGRPIS
jgi:hypothetical protein